MARRHLPAAQLGDLAGNRQGARRRRGRGEDHPGQVEGGRIALSPRQAIAGGGMTAQTNMAAAEVRTTCPYCGVGCGVLAKVAADGSVSVRGDPDHPANFGKLCSKGSALGETMGLDGRAAPSRDRRQARRLGRRARPRRRDLLETIARARPGLGRLLRFRPVADRGLLRRQQADEGLHRLGQHRHQFAALHGLVGRRPSPRLRRRHRARRLRGFRAGRPRRADRLQHRLVPPDPLPAPARGRARARHQDRRDRSAPHCDRRRMRPASGARPGHRRAAVQRTACAPCPQRHVDSGFIARSTSAASRPPSRLPAPTRRRSSASPRAAGLRRRTCGSFYDLFAATDRTVTVYSQGVNQSAHGTDKVNAIINCHLATGPHRQARAWGRSRSPASPTPWAGARSAAWPTSLPRIWVSRARRRRPRRPLLAGAEHRPQPGLKAVDLFQAAGDGRIKALWIMGTNPAVSMPDAGTRPRGAEGLRLRRRVRRRHAPTRPATPMCCCPPRPGARRTARSPIRSAASRGSEPFLPAARRGEAGLAHHLRRRRAAWALPRRSASHRPGRDLSRACGAVRLRERRRTRCSTSAAWRHRQRCRLRGFRAAPLAGRREARADRDDCSAMGASRRRTAARASSPVRQEGTGACRRCRLIRSPSTPAACATSGTP